jgi:hypothetical protein
MASGIKITKLLITDLRQSAIHLPEEETKLSLYSLSPGVLFNEHEAAGQRKTRGKKRKKQLKKLLIIVCTVAFALFLFCCR